MLAKAQHYVPQFYLRKFGFLKKKSYYIFCYDKTKRKSFKTNIKNIAQETGFYNVEIENYILTVEPSLSDLESKFKNSLEELLNNKLIANLSLNIKKNISRFIALQINRTPVLKTIGDQFNEGLINKWPELKERYRMPDKNEKKLFQIKYMFKTIESFSKIICGLEWFLLENSTTTFLWTSDNPVFKHNDLRSEFGGNLGLQCEGIQIYFPINPKLVLLIYDKNAYPKMPEHHIMGNEEIKFNNCMQIIHSIRYIFSNTNNFEMATKYLAKYPKYGDLQRERILMS